MKEPEIVPLEQTLSNKIPIVPILGHPVYPGVFTPLMINSPDDLKAVEEAYSGNGFIGVVMLKNEAESPSIKDLYSVGTVARIIKKINLPDGGLNIFVSTIKRFKIKKVINQKDPMIAIVEYLDDDEFI